MFIILVICLLVDFAVSAKSNLIPKDKCTAIGVGKVASSDGSTFTSMTTDCAECDWRVNKVIAVY